MNWKRYFIIAISIVSMLLGAAIAHAQGPQPGGKRAPGAPAYTTRLTYQGRLTNSSGAPLNSAVNMVFKLYDSASVLQWTSATRSVTPVDGLFTVYLGDGADPALTVWVFKIASIGVTVGSDPEMSPRQPLNTIYGYGDDWAGVVGTSNSGFGVNGFSQIGYGVYGHSFSNDGVRGSSDSQNGVMGQSYSGEGVMGDSYSGDGVIGQSFSNTGVTGLSTSGRGVLGQSNSNDGVYGSSNTSVGVYGSSTSYFGVLGSSQTSYGVFGGTNSLTAAGVLASGVGPSGSALEISTGGIKVSGAGIGTNTPVFVHQVTAGTINPSDTAQTIITHPLTDWKNTAILIITPAQNYGGSGGTNSSHTVGVSYNTSLNQWVIRNIDGTAMVAGQQFNVLVITP